MNVQWFSKNLQGSAAIYETNITLNTIASSNFKNAHATLIGFDKSSNSVVIKAISKDEVELGLYKEEELHKIAIKPSYGRISGKSIIKTICSFYPLDFTKKLFHKFNCDWVQKDKMLKICLNEEVE